MQHFNGKKEEERSESRDRQLARQKEKREASREMNPTNSSSINNSLVWHILMLYHTIVYNNFI